MPQKGSTLLTLFQNGLEGFGGFGQFGFGIAAGDQVGERNAKGVAELGDRNNDRQAGATDLG